MGNKIEGNKKAKKLTSAELRKKKKDRMARRKKGEEGMFLILACCPIIANTLYSLQRRRVKRRTMADELTALLASLFGALFILAS